MMYIRTKDGVYRLVDTYYMCVDGVETYMYDNNGRGVEIRGSQILAKSENLEELCDEFVLIEHYSDREDIYHHYRDKKSFIEDYIGYEHIDIVLRCYTIYGAIWTDKGLIYVAKMNESGELELI